MMVSRKGVNSAPNMQEGRAGIHTYRQMVNATLGAMLGEYKKNNSWQDSEIEDPAQSLLFKRAEALLSFILPLEIKKPKDQTDIIEGNKWFLTELRALLQLVEVDGFDPNPYTYLSRGQKINFVDCAAIILELLVLTKKNLPFVNLKSDAVTLEKAALQCYDFLKKASSSDGKSRIAWAANEIVKFKNQSLTNVYFTSFAVKSLALLISERPWAFVSEKNDELFSLIQGGVNWLIDRCIEAPGLPYFDTQKTEASYFDFALMMSAIVKSQEYLSDSQKSKILSIAVSFIEKLPEISDSPRFMYFVPAKQSSPIYYDNRLSAGVVVTALCQIRRLPGLMPESEEILLSKLAFMITKLLNSRGAVSNLWSEESYFVSQTMWGISGLLYMDAYGRTLDYSVNEAELYRIIRIALSDPRVMKAVTQAFQEELYKKGNVQ